MLLARLSLLFVALCVLAGSGVAGARVRTQSPVSGGTLNVAAEAAVDGYNIYDACCDEVWAGYEEQPVLLGAFVETPDGSFQPQLATSVDVATSPSFTLTYHIDPNAVWSDGQPVTAQDFIFTWQAITDSSNDVASTAGYDQITSMTALDSKTVRAVFSAPFAAWQELFAPVLPEHVLSGQDFDSIWTSGIDDPHTGQPIGDGPFLMPDSSSSSQVTLVRNPRWWGPHPAFLNSIVFHVVDSLGSEESGIAHGQFQMIFPSTDGSLKPLLTTSGVAFQSLGSSPVFDNLWFNVSGGSIGPLEDQAWVRQAIAYSIDRSAIADAIFSPLLTSLQPNQSLLTFPGDPAYDSAFSGYTYSKTQVATIMTNHGCTMSGGTWVCSGQPMSFTVEYVQGDSLAQTEAAMMQTEAQSAGINLLPRNVDPSDFFGNNGIPAGNFQLALFADVTSGDPSDWQPVYTCNGDENLGNFCDSAVDSGFATVATDLDPTQRSADALTLDNVLAGDVPALPMIAEPQYLFYSARVHGLVDTPYFAGPLWNAEDIWLGPTAAVPTISSFSPNHFGGFVTIDGTGFSQATRVTFGGTPAASFTVFSDTQMRADPASGSPTGVIAVTGQGGTGTSSDLFYEPPSIATMSPRNTTTTPTTVTVTGANFLGASQVTLGANPVSFTVVSNTQLTFTVPPGAVSGIVQVTVPDGTAASTQQFAVIALPPQIHSVAPTQGQVGAAVTINGAHLTGATGVSFNGTPAVSFLVVSDSVITAVVPAGATSGHVSVTGPGGTIAGATVFTVLPAVAAAPSITSFTPTSGNHGVRVVLHGSAFTGATSVKFNGRTALFTVVSDEIIYAYVPVGATSGPISVTTPAGIGASAASFSA